MFKCTFTSSQYNHEEYGSVLEQFTFNRIKSDIPLFFHRDAFDDSVSPVPYDLEPLDNMDPLHKALVTQGKTGYEGMLECSFDTKYAKAKHEAILSHGCIVSTSFLYSIEMIAFMKYQPKSVYYGVKALKDAMAPALLPSQRMVLGRTLNKEEAVVLSMGHTNVFNECGRMHFIFDDKIGRLFPAGCDLNSFDQYVHHLVSFIDTVNEIVNPKTILIPIYEGAMNLLYQLVPYLPNQMNYALTPQMIQIEKEQEVHYCIFVND